MHPFRTDETFVRNSWYVGCAGDEAGDRPFERVILGEPIVFYRSGEGKACAMHGLCPHRFFPLALHGKVEGERIICKYHGFTFDGKTGACVGVPSQSMVPNFKQRIYPTIERGPWIWVWTGDPELADESLIPSVDDLGFGSEFVHVKPFSFLSIKARYMLLVDNLMDLTHLGHLHGDMGEFGLYVDTPMEIEELNGKVRVVRSMRDGWTQQHDVIFGSENRFEGLSDFSSITTLFGPGYATTTGHITHSIDGMPSVDKTVYGDLIFHHAVTPETSHSCHYFGTTSRTHKIHDLEFDEMLRSADQAVRAQDVEAAEAIEARMLQFGEPKLELMVKSDLAAGVVRRRIQRAIDAEQMIHIPQSVE
jgi:phenylpropionate dioxygenase-like ring-hydroxylating dioxygenase large terminal subunit